LKEVKSSDSSDNEKEILEDDNSSEEFEGMDEHEFDLE